MSVRRLHETQPDSFAFSAENIEWSKGQIAKYPEGRQASAIIPLLWQAQKQEGWLSEPAIRYIADMLDMPYMRALEVATFYTMFNLNWLFVMRFVCQQQFLAALPEAFLPSADSAKAWVPR